MLDTTLYSNNTLIELLRIAEHSGAIQGWSVDRQNIVFHSDTARYSVPVVEAGSFVRRMILGSGQATATPVGT